MKEECLQFTWKLHVKMLQKGSYRFCIVTCHIFVYFCLITDRCIIFFRDFTDLYASVQYSVIRFQLHSLWSWNCEAHTAAIRADNKGKHISTSVGWGRCGHFTWRKVNLFVFIISDFGDLSVIVVINSAFVIVHCCLNFAYFWQKS